jgi:hypothetical protein
MAQMWWRSVNIHAWSWVAPDRKWMPASRSAVTISRAWNLFNSQKNSSASDRIERFTEAIVYDIDKRVLSSQ